MLPTVEESLAAVPEVPTVTPHVPQTELPPTPAVAPADVSRSQLHSMRLDELQNLAVAFGLDRSGKRPVLIARIKQHLNTARAKP